MDCFEWEDNLSVVQKTSESEKPPIRVVITEATNYMARSLAYRLLSDEVFGPDQEIILSLYDTGNSAVFLEGVAIEITASAPNLLANIIYSKEPEKAFKDADIIFSIGKIRDYNFYKAGLHNNPFFKDAVLETKNNAKLIEIYAKKDAKIITLGSTTARIFAEYAPSIPKENITATSLIHQKSCSFITRRTNRLPNDVKNLIIWGTNYQESFPYCTYAKFSDGEYVMKELNDDTWCKKTLPKLLTTRVFQKCRYRVSEVLALADHCKYLMQGTKDGEWISMSVFSDGSYETTPGVFFSFPVYCKNGKWEIVQGLKLDDYCKYVIRQFIDTVDENIETALEICKQKNFVKPKVIKAKRKQSARISAL